MKKPLRLCSGLRRLMVALLLSFGPVMGAGGCFSPDLVSPTSPIPPPDPAFGPPTSEFDAAGVSHTYWKVSSPPSSALGHVWIYIDNDTRGLGVSTRALADGSYSTRIEGQEGDRILFGFGAAFADAETRLCRLLREGVASTPCR